MREFKAPRRPPSPSTKAVTSPFLYVSKNSSQSASNGRQHAHESAQSTFAEFHAVSAGETTQVAVKSVPRPSTARKRPRSWLSSREVAVIVEERTRGATVAGRTYGAGLKDKVVASHKKDAMKTAKLHLAHASKGLKQSDVQKVLDRSDLSSDGSVEAKVAALESEVKATGGKNSLLKMAGIRKQQEKDATSDDTVKRRRFAAEMKLVGGVGKRKRSTLNDVVELNIGERMTSDNVTKRLWFDDEALESDSIVKESEFLLKSPLKRRRKLRTEMLDESQYWMAVDRFSDLT